MIYSVQILLDRAEARVLGSLIEKEITTPDYYPLSLNAIGNACNQKSNRDPVMDLDEGAVTQALRGLQQKGLARPADNWDSRVTKYEHSLQEAFNFDRRETAILCVLLLRGLQTPGELRGRSERLHRFDDLTEVQSALQRLMTREPPLVKVLARRPGTKEVRYAHLLSGDVEDQESQLARDGQSSSSSDDTDRLGRVESEIGELRTEVADLKQELMKFRKQFE
jgi:uncharacterized protein YceH (UPF0502 family)